MLSTPHLVTYATLMLLSFSALAPISYGKTIDIGRASSQNLQNRSLMKYKLELVPFKSPANQNIYRSHFKMVSAIRSNIGSSYREGYLTPYEYNDIIREFKTLISEIDSYHTYLYLSERGGLDGMNETAENQQSLVKQSLSRLKAQSGNMLIIPYTTPYDIN